MQDSITLTSKLGSFIFDSDVVLSRAKLIRDTVTGQFFNPKSDGPKIHCAEDAEKYIRNHPSQNIASITFDVIFNKMTSLVEPERSSKREYHSSLCAIRQHGGTTCSCEYSIK